MRPRFPILACAAALLAGCGGEDDERADVLRERNRARVDGLDYRVPLFRQLNPRIAPDAAYYDGPGATAGQGVYAAFVRVCNPGGDGTARTARVYLEDAFGERFMPVPQPGNELAYAPRRLAPGACLPGRDAVAEADGAVVAFRLPFDDVAERPLRLVIDAPGETAKLELDV